MALVKYNNEIMKTLAVDNSAGICSVAVMDGDKLLAMRHDSTQSRQAGLLLPMIEECLAESGLSYNNLDLLSSTIGPGSFTGLRIGIAAIKGIAMVTGLPAVGVSSLEAVAWAAGAEAGCKKILVLLNANRGEIYAQGFSVNNGNIVAINEAMLIKTEDMADYIKPDILVAGNCREILEESDVMNVTENILPDAKYTAIAAQHKYAVTKNYGFSPLYIRKPDAKLPQAQ